MWRESRLWGENRIAGELAKLGWRVSPRTVAKYRPNGLSRGRRQGWSTFLRNHASEVWACDFFTVVSVHFRTLYAFVVVSLERRRIVHVGVTAHPTGAWVAQRMVEAVGESLHREYARYYYHGRPHRSLRAQPPAGAHWFAPARPATCQEVVATPILGGLHHEYGFLAAPACPPA